MEWISVLAHKFRGEDQTKLKNGLRRKILGFVLAFNRVFRPETRLYSCLGAQRPRNALPWHRACYFLLEHNPRMVGTFLAWRSQTVIREAQPQNATPRHRACLEN